MRIEDVPCPLNVVPADSSQLYARSARAGDTVRIVETRPLAKTVRWRVTEIVERAK